nr:sulfatase-like hydrolase/transferase [Pseudomaricurvus alkylphenolicus]
MTVSQVGATQLRPNVLLVVADDLGYTDLGSFGGEISTPNLDSLATNGMRFSSFYTAPTCSPTRAMLLTGADNHLVGLGTMREAMADNQRGKPGYEGHLNDRAASLPRAFADAGYRTLMTGKWHLGHKKEHSPAARGFTHSFALLDGGAGHFSDLGIDKQHASYRENGEFAKLPDDFYSSRFYTDKMIDYIETGRDSGKPFFAYLAYTAPHWPLQAKKSTIKKYSGVYQRGYDDIRSERMARAINLGVMPVGGSASLPLNGERDWRQLSEDQKRTSARKMEIYAAMVDDMDANFGRLVEYLKSTDQFDNTIIFFMSDNGAEGATIESEYPFLTKHAETCCDNSYANLGNSDSYIFYGAGWARASVGNSRDYKGRTTEGGIRSPAFIHYRGINGAGSVSNRFFTVKDVLPTLMQLSDVNIPQGFEVPVEGRSIWRPQLSAAEMGWEFVGGRAYRKGNWKLVSTTARHGGDNSWRLYNLHKDPGEQKNLASEHPRIFQEMVKLFEAYEDKAGIVYPDNK